MVEMQKGQELVVKCSKCGDTMVRGMEDCEGGYECYSHSFNKDKHSKLETVNLLEQKYR